MHYKFNKIVTYLGALSLTIFFSACNSGSSGGESSQTPIAQQTVSQTSMAYNTESIPENSGQSVDIAVSPDGKYLYSTVYSSDESYNISYYKINPSDGTLSYVNNLSPNEKAIGIAITPDGKHAYTTQIALSDDGDSASAYITWYNINTSDGSLAYAGKLKVEYVTRGIAISPDGTHLYVTTDAGLKWYDINLSNSSLTYRGSLDIQVPPVVIKIAPDGAHAYSITNKAAEQFDPYGSISYISWYNVNPSTGDLTYSGMVQLGNSKFYPTSGGIAISADNAHVYIDGAATYIDFWTHMLKYKLYVLDYSINSTDGSLNDSPTELSTNSWECYMLVGLATSPDGKYLYVVPAPQTISIKILPLK